MRSKSKERPHIPKLNLDYSYLEQKCIERDLIEKQMLQEITMSMNQAEDQLVESSQYAMIDGNNDKMSPKEFIDHEDEQNPAAKFPDCELEDL